MKNTTIQIIKFNIKTECRHRKIKIKDLCKRMGFTRYYISNLENPSINTIINIANYIGCTPSDLLKGI